jgi:hypothetical protein
MSKFNQQQPNNNFYSKKQKAKAPWNLLPSWIKFFTWMFLFFSVLEIVFGFRSFILDGNFDCDIYGLQATKIRNIGELALIIHILNFLVAYGLFFQKTWAVKAGITNAIIGILICIFVIITSIFLNRVNFRFEIIILLFYYSKLQDIKEDWASIKMNPLKHKK